MKKMKNKKLLIMASSLVITAASLSFAMPGPAHAAADGWTKDSEGRTVTNGPVLSGDNLYYADADGKKVTNQWMQLKDQPSGSQLTNGWYYFGSDGKAFNYDGNTGVKKQINGKTYVFDSNGRMETGWLDDSGEPLGEDDSPLENGVYYAGEDGALLKDQWLNYNYTGEILKDDPDSDPYGTDYGDYSQIWLYFDGDFKRVSADDGQIRQKVIDGNTYGFDDHGVMLPWWNPVAATSSSAQKNANEKPKYFSPSTGGELLKDSWFWMYPSKNMDEDDYKNQEYSWWHTDHNGKLDKNRIKKINGKSYAFDKLGRMQTGFVIFNGNSGFTGIQYDLDKLTSDDFKDGTIVGIDGIGNKLYLFGPDELNDGSMKTGKNIKVELSDDTFTFGFAENGVAYGNGNRLQNVGDTFYINGLRLDADDGFKYGVVRDAKGNCYVVDVNGRKVTGDKKVIKDGEGGWIIILKGRFMARVIDDDKPRWHDGEDGPGFYHYDSGSKGKYGTLIAKYGDEPDTASLPDEEELYIK